MLEAMARRPKQERSLAIGKNDIRLTRECVGWAYLPQAPSAQTRVSGRHSYASKRGTVMLRATSVAGHA